MGRKKSADKDEDVISVSHFSDIVTARVRKRLAAPKTLLPKVGDIVIINEKMIFPTRERLDGAWIGKVIGQTQYNTVVSVQNGHGGFYTTTFLNTDIRLNIVVYVKISSFPERELTQEELRIDKLPDDVAPLVIS